ncbi:hypothetical protein MBLNU230_g4557t1 [Neophaeotheca triangularis]
MPAYNVSRLLGIDFPGRRTSPPGERAIKSAPVSTANSRSQTPTGIKEVHQRQNMPEHIKRPSLVLGKKHGSDKSSRRNSKERSPSKDKHAKPKDPGQVNNGKPVSMELVMESPPALLIDPPQQSSGAIISGRLQITPKHGDVKMESIAMFLECTTSTKRPVVDRCRACTTQINDLFHWNFLTKPSVFPLAEGKQDLPFSHMIPGHLPVTTHGWIGSIDYSLHVRGRTSDGRETEFRRPLVVRRALRPGNDKNSVRVFPPTNLTLHVSLPSSIHPIGDFPVQCRMTGITTKNADTQTRWRLRKLTWRVEEEETSISPACEKHGAKLGGAGKGIQHSHTRELGSEELKNGWKTDFNDGIGGGQVEGEFLASLNATNAQLPAQCDVEAANGLKISHHLILELVIAEEWAPNKKPHSATPTGAARVLRTQFNLNLTERAGLGIAWDDEMPPLYEDVEKSPPGYLGGAGPRAADASTANGPPPPLFDAVSAGSRHHRRQPSGGDTTSIMDYEGDDLHEDIEALQLDR